MYSVPRIVALINVRANTGTRARMPTGTWACHFLGSSSHYFNVHALFSGYFSLIFFLKFLRLKNWVDQLYMQTKFWYQYFWLWRQQSLTHMVVSLGLSRNVVVISNIFQCYFQQMDNANVLPSPGQSIPRPHAPSLTPRLAPSTPTWPITSSMLAFSKSWGRENALFWYRFQPTF